MEIRNPFRDRTMRATFDAVVMCYKTRHRDIWGSLQYGEDAVRQPGAWPYRPGNAWAGNFWRGYDGIPQKYSGGDRDTPGYACFRAGQIIRKAGL